MSEEKATQELQEFLKEYPDTQLIELLAPDMNGMFRGKRVGPEDFKKLFTGGANFCASTIMLDSKGDLGDALDYGSRETIAAAHRGIGRLKARTLFDATGRTEAHAEKSFRECIRVFRESGNRHEVARTQAELGYHLVEHGDTAGAREVLQQALTAMKALNLPDQAKIGQTLRDLGGAGAASVSNAPPR